MASYTSYNANYGGSYDYRRGMGTSPELQAANTAVSSAIPGLSTSDLDALGAQLSATTRAGTHAALGQAGRQLGTATPQYARLAAQLNMAAGSRAAAQFADIRIQDQRNNQQLEQARRQQLVQLAAIGQQREEANAQFGLQSAGLDQQRRMALIQAASIGRGLNLNNPVDITIGKQLGFLNPGYASQYSPRSFFGSGRESNNQYLWGRNNALGGGSAINPYF